MTGFSILGAGATSARFGDALTGDVVVLALPYGAVADVVGQYATQLDGKVVVDITNPLDFATFDDLAVAAGTSAAQQIAALVPGAHVLKAFNTNFAATLATAKVGGGATTTVLVAGDDADAKATLIGVVEAAGLGAVDAGSLKRAEARGARLPAADARRRREDRLDRRVLARPLSLALSLGQCGARDYRCAPCRPARVRPAPRETTCPPGSTMRSGGTSIPWASRARPRLPSHRASLCSTGSRT